MMERCGSPAARPNPCLPLEAGTRPTNCSEKAGVSSAGSHQNRQLLEALTSDEFKMETSGIAPELDCCRGCDLGAWDVLPGNLGAVIERLEEHTSELQSLRHLVCR